MSENEKSWDFDGWADRYDETVAADSRLNARYDEVLDFVAEIANVSAQTTVLDIGTGTGNLALRCLAHGAKVIGLDPSGQMLANAIKKVGDNPKVEFRQVEAPFLDIPYPDGSFDAVVSTYAFHHIPHRLKLNSVYEMIRVLKPGGRWVLGDLMFKDEKAEQEALRQYEWLDEEYFEYIEELRTLFVALGMELNAKQFTPVTWVLWTVKLNDVKGTDR